MPNKTRALDDRHWPPRPRASVYPPLLVNIDQGALRSIPHLKDKPDTSGTTFPEATEFLAPGKIQMQRRYLAQAILPQAQGSPSLASNILIAPPPIPEVL